MAREDGWEKHKYIARIPIKKVRGRTIYRYFYDKPEYENYLNSLNSNTKSNAAPTNIVAENTQPEKNKNEDKPKESFFDKLVNSGKKFVEQIVKIADKVSDAVVESGKKFVTSVVSNFDKAADNVAEAAEVGKKIISNIFEKIDEAKKRDADMKAVNPDYDPSDYGSSNNCAYCTAAYDLRQRGFDVTAIKKDPLTDMGIVPEGKEHLMTTLEHIVTWYKDPPDVNFYDLTVNREFESRSERDKFQDEKNKHITKLIENQMIEEGDGAYGHFMMYWRNGGGHDVVWSVENGKVVLRDAQTNTKYKIEDLIDYCTDVMYFRSDNLAIDTRIFDLVDNVNVRRRQK